MSEEREPTLRDVLHAVQGIETKVHANGAAILELGGEVGEVRIGLGDMRGRLDRVDGRLDALTGEVETLGRETRRELQELPAQVVAGVLVGFERSAYATDLRTLQVEVAELKADVAALKNAASGSANGGRLPPAK